MNGLCPAHTNFIKHIEGIRRQDESTSNLADRLGVAANSLGRWLKGETTPTLENLEKVAESLRTHPWELIKPPGAEDAKDRILRDTLAALELIGQQLHSLAHAAPTSRATESPHLAVVERRHSPEFQELVELLATFDDEEIANLLKATRLRAGKDLLDSSQKTKKPS